MIGTIIIMIGSTTIQQGRVHVDMREFDTKEGMDNLLEYLFGDSDNDSTTIQDNNDTNIFESYDNSVKKDPIVHQFIENDNKVDIDNGFMSDKYDEPVKTIYDHINDVTSVNDTSSTIQDNVDFSLVSFDTNSPKRCELDDLFDDLKDNKEDKRECQYYILHTSSIPQICSTIKEDTDTSGSTIQDDDNKSMNWMDWICKISEVLNSENNEVQRLKIVQSLRPQFNEYKEEEFNKLETTTLLPDPSIPQICSTIKEIFGRKWKTTFNNLFTLGEFCHSFVQQNARKVAYDESGIDLIDLGIIDGDEFTAFSLSQTNTTIQKTLGFKQSSLKKLIAKAVEIGLIACVDESYIPGQACKLYKLNYRKFNIFKNVKKIESDNPTHQLTPISLQICSTIKEIEVNDVQIKHSISHRAIGNASDESIINALKNHYGKAWWDKYITEDDGFKFTPTIHRSNKGNVTKIGLRETCKFANSRKALRNKILTDKWGTFDENEQSYDVKSSIYKLTYFLNKGVWLDENVDCYAEMCPFQFRDDSDRAAYKSLAMRLYFDRSSDEVIGHIKRCFLNALKNRTMSKDEYSIIIGRVYSIIPKLYKGMRDYIGETYDNEIFMYESVIYKEVRHELQSRGFNIEQCYDCFYADKKLPTNMNEIISEKANQVIRESIVDNGTSTHVNTSIPTHTTSEDEKNPTNNHPTPLSPQICTSIKDNEFFEVIKTIKDNEY